MIDKIKLEEYKNKDDLLNNLKNELSIKRTAFDESNKDLIEKIVKASNEQDLLKFDLKQDALCEYQETKVKQLTGGLGIRVMNNLIYEEDEAYDWAKEHNLCLKLDVKAFEQIAKSQQINFVRFEESLVVTFPKELKI